MNETDLELLHRYTRHRAEEAFAELVHRHLNLVYCAALRQVRSPQLAEEVAQSAFTDLARNAGRLAPDTIVAAWLYQVTRRTAIDVVRREARRQMREQVASQMNAMNATEADWTQVEPLLDDAMAALDDTDRAAVLLRYFENKSLREVGQALATSDDAAQKRVSRAVERLREFFTKHGVTVGKSGLIVAISGNAVQAAPVGLAAMVASAIRAKSAASAGTPAVSHSLVGQLKLAAALALMTCIAVLVWQRKTQPVVPGVAEEVATIATTPEVNTSAPKSPFTRRLRANSAVNRAPQRVRMKFTVVDAVSGQGLGDVQIRAAFFYAGGRGESHRLTTDVNGDAAIPEANEGGNPGFNVFASIEGYVPKAVGFGPGAPSEYQLKLEPAAMARGVVVDEQGLPVAGVKLQASRSEDYVNGAPNTDFQTTHVETDIEGRWVYHYIPNTYNEVHFDLTCEGYAVTRASVKMRGAEAQSAALVIRRGFAVVGWVMDEQGAPVAGASVKELHNFGHRKLSAETDANGAFSLLGLSTNSDSKIQIAIQAQGLAAQSPWIELREPTNAVQIILAKGNIFQGRVVDEGGNPIPKAVVRTDYDFKNQVFQRFEWRVETDGDGQFDWDSAPAEVICYWFEADGYEVIRGRPLPADGTVHQIVLKSK